MKFTLELAQYLRDEAFSDEEKLIFNAVVGNKYIDISNRLFHIYQNYYVRANSKEELLDRFLVIKGDTRSQLIINQILTYQDQIEKLVNPKYFYKEGDSSTDSNTTLINNFESKTTNKDGTGTYNYTFDEASAQHKAGTLIRGAATQTSQKNKGIEKQWKKDLLLDVKAQLVKRKEIDKLKLLNDDNFELDESDVGYELVEAEKQEPEADGAELYSQLNIGLTGAVDSTYNSAGNESLAIAKSKAKTDSESETYSSTTYNVKKDYKSFVHNDATLRALRLDIAPLFSKFFKLFFNELFYLP